MHLDTASRQRERDPAGADAEFERVRASEIGEEVDDGIDDVPFRLIPVPPRRSAPPHLARNGLPATARRAYSASTRTAHTLYSGVPISGSPT